MKQIDIKFQYAKKGEQTYSPFGGALLVDDIFKRFGIDDAIDRHIGARRANAGVRYTDRTYMKSLVLMQLFGGDTVDDLQMIREDPVAREILGPIPGRTSFHNYLSSFADEMEESKRGQGKSVILTPNRHLGGFDEVTRHYLSAIPSFAEVNTVTLDQDATFIPCGVRGALYNYKSEKSFQALNTYCDEYDMTIHSEFRDGNVSPGYQQLEQLKASLEVLPASVKKVRLRSDTAGYQIELLKYCAQGDNQRFGVIDFAIGCPVTAELKAAVAATNASEWHRVDDDQECAVITFAPNSLSLSKNSPEYRFIAIREVLCEHVESAPAQRCLFPDEEDGVSSLHPTLMNGKVYKVFALVTNLIHPLPEKIVRWYHKRCGKSEEIHRILKNDLAGGHVVTKALGANAAWWQIVILSANLLSLIKRCCLPEKYLQARPKRLRLLLFSVVARVTRHARKHCIVVYASTAARLLEAAWIRLAGLQMQLE
jgi:hypothetical protein